MAREKKNKIVQKSVGLSEVEWAIIEKLAVGADCSNGAIIRTMLQDWIFLGYLRNESKKISELQNIYNGKLSRKDEIPVIENPYEKSLSDLLKAFPQIENITEILKD